MTKKEAKKGLEILAKMQKPEIFSDYGWSVIKYQTWLYLQLKLALD